MESPIAAGMHRKSEGKVSMVLKWTLLGGGEDEEERVRRAVRARREKLVEVADKDRALVLAQKLSLIGSSTPGWEIEQRKRMAEKIAGCGVICFFTFLFLLISPIQAKEKKKHESAQSCCCKLRAPLTHSTKPEPIKKRAAVPMMNFFNGLPAPQNSKRPRDKGPAALAELYVSSILDYGVYCLSEIVRASASSTSASPRHHHFCVCIV